VLVDCLLQLAMAFRRFGPVTLITTRTS